MSQNEENELIKFIQENEKNININNSLDYAKIIVNKLKYDKIVKKYLTKLKSYSKSTYIHSLNVAIISTIISLGMKMDAENIIDIAKSALLHDIGKIKINKDILDKPDLLTKCEYEGVQMHSIYGYSMLRDEKINQYIKLGVLFHHENHNGTGYPLGLNGDKIPDIASIIHFADIYEAMTAKRTYKESISISECVEYMMSLSGTIVSPNVLKAFLLYFPAYEIGEIVKLSTGDEAVVVKNYANHSLRPKVKTKKGMIIPLNKEQYYNITVLNKSSNL